MKGRIVGLNCGFYSVEADGIIFKVKAKGSLRNKTIKPVVGDMEELDDTYFISISWHKSGKYIIEKGFNDFEFSDNYNTLYIYNEDKSTKFAKINN